MAEMKSVVVPMNEIKEARIAADGESIQLVYAANAEMEMALEISTSELAGVVAALQAVGGAALAKSGRGALDPRRDSFTGHMINSCEFGVSMHGDLALMRLVADGEPFDFAIPTRARAADGARLVDDLARGLAMLAEAKPSALAH